MLEPQQALFIAIRKALEELYPGSVYDGAIPGPETEYPFTYLGEFNQVDRETKSVIIGYIPVTIHNWHNRTDKRGTLSTRNQAVKAVLRAADHPDYAFHVRNVVSRIIPDNTTSVPLMHGIVEADVYFTPKH